jgi:Kef-type K+ transport system membrane component KefB
MNENGKSHSGFKRFIGYLCFALFGIVSAMQPGRESNVLNIVYGMLVGIVFGWVSMLVLAIFLGWINSGLKKTQKRGFARRAISAGMVFMVPFALMAFIAAYYLHWKSAGLFISAAISAVAVATGAEISKLYEKPKLWNNIVPSILASACSMAWLYLIVQVQSFPSTIINLYTLVTTFLSMTQ